MQGERLRWRTEGVGFRSQSWNLDLFCMTRRRDCWVHACWIGSRELLRSKCSCRLGYNQGKPGSPACNQRISDMIQGSSLCNLPCRKPSWPRLCQICDCYQHQPHFKNSLGRAHKHCFRTLTEKPPHYTLWIILANTTHLHSLRIRIVHWNSPSITDHTNTLCAPTHIAQFTSSCSVQP
jgi:hypothetical protein